MQDLKHLTQRKRFPAFANSRASRGNRRLAASRHHLSRQLTLPDKRKRIKIRKLLLPLSILLVLTPLCIYTLGKVPVMAMGVVAWFQKQPSQTPREAQAARQPETPPFQMATSLLDSAIMDGDRFIARTSKGDTLLYTIQGDLQKRVHDFMVDQRVPYGVFVAIEPATGRILAMTAHSSTNPEWERNAFFDIYPMASLFKIVTASAALENKLMTPDTVVEFRGSFVSETPGHWQATPRGRNNRLDVGCAMGKSVNPVYGRVAADIAGKANVMQSVDRFGFNQKLLPGIPVKESRAAEPRDEQGLMLMGAGLDHEVKVSPLHAATIMAAIANNGRMMYPALTEKVTDPSGKTKLTHTPREIRRLVSPETAESLTRMLSNTVTNGTSRRAFHDRQGRPLLDVDVCAKTGTIDGTDPQGHYSWFAAFAPAQNPRIALVALVINRDRWKIKSSQVGQQALEEFFER
jgi:cell division protein FtsI/penicillin-binding protein 2